MKTTFDRAILFCFVLPKMLFWGIRFSWHWRPRLRHVNLPNQFFKAYREHSHHCHRESKYILYIYRLSFLLFTDEEGGCTVAVGVALMWMRHVWTVNIVLSQSLRKDPESADGGCWRQQEPTGQSLKADHVHAFFIIKIFPPELGPEAADACGKYRASRANRAMRHQPGGQTIGVCCIIQWWIWRQARQIGRPAVTPQSPGGKTANVSRSRFKDERLEEPHHNTSYPFQASMTRSWWYSNGKVYRYLQYPS